jgi:tetratricopeptide (TPR) repeat protein
MLALRSKDLQTWERAGLILPKAEYGFADIGQLIKLRDLRARRISAAHIQASVTAMRAVSGVSDPLLESSAVVNGSRVAFRHFGAVVEPIARQFLLDFDGALRGQLAEVGDTAARQASRDALAQSLFMQAVQMEEAARNDEASALYEQVLSMDPAHAPSCINLGTIAYNQREFLRAETLYRRATVADPGYALAFFDLGNVLDELQRLPEAIEAYRKAIRLAPKYADAHYNLALAYERSAERRRALRHWAAYLKLDASGPWAKHARDQLAKILDREKLKIVHRSARKTMRGFSLPTAQ